MGHWIYWNSPTIQAVCQIFGLVGLLAYAVETYRIRRSTLSESDASRRPFFEIFVGEYGLRVKNTGAGIALNVKWMQLEGPSKIGPVDIGAIATQMYFIMLTPESQDRLKSEHLLEYPVRITYTDTAGKKYWTVIKGLDNFHYRIDTGEGT
jgi:hypothetical protein